MSEKTTPRQPQDPAPAPPAPGRRRFPTRHVATAAAWCLIALVAWVGIQRTLLAPTPVMVVTPQKGELRQEVFGTGTLESKVIVGLSAKITGKVAEVLVDQGDAVTNGQTLARLEASDFEDAVRAADAALGQAKAELAKAEVDLKRDADLLQSKTIPKSEYDATETACRVAEARVSNTQAQLGVARARLADTRISSPVTGLVITRNLEVGSTVVPGTPIFRLAETNTLWIQAMVDEREAGKLKLGQSARITFRSAQGQSFTGRLVRLSREADRVTEEREADVIADRLPADWFIGAKADVYIETASKPDVLQLPPSAVVRRGEQTGVFVVQGDRAQWRPVTLGLAGRERVEIVAGVDSGDRIVVNPYADKKPLADGQRVAPSPAKDRP